jgi:hypothetical protein
MKTVRYVLFFLMVFVISNVIFSIGVTACKDIVACGEATMGDYNLLLKVRDPSRSGFQVLSMVPEGYEYMYHHPWTGEALHFRVDRSYIGVTTLNDTIPNIVKPGMSLSNAGIAFGDADTGSLWRNPTRYAWDDFDWIRFACERAANEEEAVWLMTRDVVDEMHAPGISENLFVVGPEKGFIIEADAFHYSINEVSNKAVAMATYPKELWKTQLRKILIAPSFDSQKEIYVKKGDTVRLGSLYGVKIIEVGSGWITIRAIPIFKFGYRYIIVNKPVTVHLGVRDIVGDFSVKLLDIDGDRAKISLCYKYKAWEEIMTSYLAARYGSITIGDMINWSRLHAEDIENMRPMCENRSQYEASMVYKIPGSNYETLSSGWFAAGHPCCSIYVPVHICDKDVYDPFENGEGAALSLQLLHIYGHDVLVPYFSKTEEVLLYETEVREDLAEDVIIENGNLSGFFTIVDIEMQKQAWFTQQIWMGVSNLSCEEDQRRVIDIIDDLWSENYQVSLLNMNKSIRDLEDVSGTRTIRDKIGEIMQSIFRLRIETFKYSM